MHVLHNLVALQASFVSQSVLSRSKNVIFSSLTSMQSHTDDPSEILNLGKPFIECFSSLINFLNARIKHPSIIFNMFTAILLLVIVLKSSTVEGTSL